MYGVYDGEVVFSCLWGCFLVGILVGCLRLVCFRYWVLVIGRSLFVWVCLFFFLVIVLGFLILLLFCCSVWLVWFGCWFLVCGNMCWFFWFLLLDICCGFVFVCFVWIFLLVWLFWCFDCWLVCSCVLVFCGNMWWCCWLVLYFFL